MMVIDIIAITLMGGALLCLTLKDDIKEYQAYKEKKEKEKKKESK